MRSALISCCTLFHFLLLSETFAFGRTLQCDSYVAEASRVDNGTVLVRNANRLVGTWVSDGCETRPGPEYVLRIYRFEQNGAFKLLQHHYWDESCSAPKFTLTTKGTIKLGGESYEAPGGTMAHQRPSTMSIVPHDIAAAKELEGIIATECPNDYRQTLKPYEERIVFDATFNSSRLWPSFSRYPDSINYHTFGDVSSEVRCLGALQWAFNELKLVKVQLRPEFGSGKAEGARMQLELWLGDIHSRHGNRENHTPSAFQVPLIKLVRDTEQFVIGKKKFNVITCQVCSIVSSGTEKSPPHLFKKPILPPYIIGEWVSLRCEIRPMRLFLTRRFRFYSERSSWIGEHKFFADPFCIKPKFTVTAAGYFVKQPSSKIVKGSTNFDFHVQKASLVVLHHSMLHEMRHVQNCGLGKWVLDQPRELGATNGCFQLGIMIPSVQYEIVRIDVDFHGAMLLYMGQVDTENQQRYHNERPTAFQAPLVHCAYLDSPTNNLRQILNSIAESERGLTSFDYLESSGRSLTPGSYCLIVLLFAVLGLLKRE